MEEFTKYKVVLSGDTLPDQDREQVIRELCELFHSRPSRMERLVSGKEVHLKKEYTRSEAEKIVRAIREAGAGVKMIPIQQQALEVLDDDYSTLSGFTLTEHESGVPCPNCHQDCNPDWESCQHCGHALVRKEADSGFSFGVDDQSSTFTEAPKEDTKHSTKSYLVRFVGPNADYYLEKFAQMGNPRNPKFRLSWHWPALFAFFFWSLYRKMWAWAAINYACTLLLVIFTTPSPWWLGFSLIWPLSANYLYYRHVASHVRKVRSSNIEDDREEYLSSKGGVSKWALWIGIAVTFALSIITSNMIATRLLSTYTEQFGDGSGAPIQMRGDGSVLTLNSDEGSELARTSKTLNVMATGLKVVIGSGNEDLITRTLDNLVLKSDNEEVWDAWDNPIVIERAAGRVVILSPGPDGTVQTDDDIIQTVDY
ncbi:MAG: DUF2628 domain-containing protein [bacterium]